jgi:hypothetical protein
MIFMFKASKSVIRTVNQKPSAVCVEIGDSVPFVLRMGLLNVSYLVQSVFIHQQVLEE